MKKKQVLLYTLLTLLCSLWIGLMITQAQSEAEKEIQQAFIDYKAEKYTEALPIFEKYREGFEEGLKDTPDRLNNFYTILATCYQKTGKQEDYEALLPYIQNTLPPQGSWKSLNQQGGGVLSARKI